MPRAICSATLLEDSAEVMLFAITSRHEALGSEDSNGKCLTLADAAAMGVKVVTLEALCLTQGGRETIPAWATMGPQGGSLTAP